MACKSCAERRARMKVWLQQKLDQAAHWKKVREGHADQGTEAPALSSDGTEAPAEGAEQAGEASAAHGHRGMEADPGAGAGEGRPAVPRVRKARGGEGSAR